MNPSHSGFIAPVLGAPGAAGPLAIDMYLPVLPRIAAELGGSEGAMQLSLMTFFAGLMAGQLLFGPLSGRTDRKRMIQAGMLLTAMVMPEARAAELRIASRLSAVFRNYAGLLCNRHYLPFAGVCALAMGGFFACLSSSSFVFITVEGVSPAVYSTIFAFNALDLMAGAQVAPRLLGRWRLASLVRGALAVYTLAALLLVVPERAGGGSVLALTALLFVIVTAMAFVLSLASVMALESCGAISGTAAALLGAMNFGAGALASLVVGIAANGTGLPMALTIAACGLAACAVAFPAFPRARDGTDRDRVTRTDTSSASR